MAAESLRLPGVFFEAPTPVPEEGLPRMDIAAFVGFAAAGPLHVPVAVESPRRFRDIFGDDPAIAWSEERGAMRRAHLGGAVEAFFVNGGLRCWVVRVADRSRTVRHVFSLPGLIDAADRTAVPSPPATARARAAGSWCENFSVGTALSRDPLPLQAGPGAGIVLTPGAYAIDLAVDTTRVTAGDLFEIGFGPDAPVLLLFAERVTAIPGGVRVESAGLDGTGETSGAYWTQPPAAGSPALPLDDSETTPPTAIGEATGMGAAIAALGSPPARPTVRRLSFEILVWNGTELRHQIPELAFGSKHPRFWATLPTDDELFRLPLGASVPDAPAGLALDASAPRFPLAGPAAPPLYYLPWGMGRLRAPEGAMPLPATATAGASPLERDGLAQFATGLFVDDRLAPVGVGALLGEAEHRLYVAGIPLSGFHCLLPIAEASLIAVPDAVQRGWSRELPPEPAPLGAPDLHEIPPADAADRYPLTWTTVTGAEGYTLERDVDPAFADAVVAFEGEAPTAAVAIPPACPRETFFRVRAFRGGEIGPWSNTRGARLPREAFDACDDPRPPALVLDFTGDLASPGPALVWSTEDPAALLPGEVEIDESTDPGFAAAVRFAPDGMTSGYAPLPARRVGTRYYRVRGRSDAGVHGSWSNTVRVAATERATFTETAASQYDASVLLAVHRALLRFAAARGDLLALLSLPDMYRAPEALEHAGRLTPGGGEPEPAPPSGTPLWPRVAPLTEGELPVLSFGALYHPWTVSRAGRDADDPLRLLPPDGAVAGLMAALALSAGAWRAPANRPLSGVVAMEPDIRLDLWGPLVTGGVNTLLNQSRGFLTLSESTLGGERALGRIHVRRLMILLRRLALREGERLVFEPHGPQLRRRVQHQFERLLGELFKRGAFAGADAPSAFRVVADESLNTASSVDRGRLLVELRVAPAAALAYLTVRLVTAGAGRLGVEEA